MDKADVAIIVVTPETGELLDRCLHSLARQTALPREIALVLNGCGNGDNILSKWANKIPLKIMSLESNEGFAAAHLKALPTLTAKWIGVLNADAVAESDWLAELLKAGESASDIAALASAVLSADRPAYYESLGLEIGASGAVYLRKLDELLADEPVQEVFGASGCAAIYRREAIERVGFFDPEFFVYYEDADLAWRLRAAGWKIIAAPRARVHHKGSGFSAHAAKTFHLQQNRLKTILRNWPLKTIAKNIAKIISLDAAAILFGVFKERSWDSLKARLALIPQMPRLFSQRRAIMKNRIAEPERWIFDDTQKALKRFKWKMK